MEKLIGYGEKAHELYEKERKSWLGLRPFRSRLQTKRSCHILDVADQKAGLYFGPSRHDSEKQMDRRKNLSSFQWKKTYKNKKGCLGLPIDYDKKMIKNTAKMVFRCSSYSDDLFTLFGKTAPVLKM